MFNKGVSFSFLDMVFSRGWRGSRHLCHPRHPRLAILTVLLLTQGHGFSQSARTIWSGVYTEVQAERGKARYEMSCASCHKGGPPNSDLLMRDWSGTSLDSFFDRIKTTMPANAPGSLSDSNYIDIMAYILRADDFPSGSDELEPAMLKGIRLEAKDGSQQVPNFALVSVAGCLSQGSDNGWLLINASEPVRTKDPGPSKEDELKTVQSKTLGGQKLILMNVYPAPDAYKGHKVEAKGFLIRESKETRVNVTSWQSLDPSCDPPR